MKYTDPKTKIVHEFKSEADLTQFIEARIDEKRRAARADSDRVERLDTETKLDAREAMIKRNQTLAARKPAEKK